MGSCASRVPRASSSQVVSRDLHSSARTRSCVVKRPTDRKDHRALHGLTRTLVYNMVVGVTEGFEKRLEIQGVGYRAQLKGTSLELALGYSHPVRVDAPEGIEFEVPLPTQVVVRGIDKQAVGEIAARIRKTPATRALQGQGRALCRRARGEKGRQAGMTSAAVRWTTATRSTHAGARRRGPGQGDRHRRASAPVRLPLEPGLFAQLIDDERGHTLAAANWTEPDLRDLKPMEKAKRVGELLAERAKAAGVESCVFDRGGYKYHGRVKALADGARRAGWGSSTLSRVLTTKESSNGTSEAR